MANFKAGERVAVYNGQSRLTGTIIRVCLSGLDIEFDVTPEFKRVHNLPWYFSPKQCRRLTKKIKD